MTRDRLGRAEPRGERRADRTGCLAAVLALVCTAGCGSARLPDGVRAARDAVVDAARAASISADARARDAAVAEASGRVRGAAPTLDPPGPESGRLFRTALLRSARGGDPVGAGRILAVWTPDAADHEARAVAIALRSDAGAHAEAQAAAWQLVEDSRGDPDAVRLWYRTHASDPAFFAAEVRAPSAVRPVERLEHLGGGSSITFAFRSEGRRVAALKPAQTRLQSSYRGEIAAYRLCPLIRCGFEVPPNAEVRMSRSELLALWGADTRSEAAVFDRRYDDLVWSAYDGDRWLHATMKEWVDGLLGFQIEHVDDWVWLVQLSGEPPRWASSPAVVLERLTRGGRVDADAVSSLDFEDLGRQLSNLHVFDFLVNNWDRTSSRYPGSNCHWREDRIVSLDNGAAFPPVRWHDGGVAARVRQRLERVERFSRESVDAIRWMDPEAVWPILFASSSLHDESGQYEAFVARREMLLAYVDALVAEHGEEAVLSFR